MTQRLPNPGQDDGTWGTILNNFLEVSHNPDGTLQSNAIAAGGGVISSQVGAANGVASLDNNTRVPSSQLGSGTATSSSFLRGDGTWATPGGGGLPASDDLSAIAATNATVGDVSMNGHKLTHLTNGSASDDAAAFGQIPIVGAAGSGATNALSANDPSTTNSRTPTGSAGGSLSGTYPNPIATSVNGLAVTPSTGTLTIANGKTVTADNTLTLAGTDNTIMTFPASSAILAGTDISQTWSAPQVYNNGVLVLSGSLSGTTVLNATATASGTLTLPGTTDTIVARATTDTLSNKRITSRVSSLTVSSNTYTINGDTTDIAEIAVAPVADFTIAAPTGTPTDGQMLMLRITSGVTGFTPTWNTIFVSSGIATLPNGALPASKTVTFGFQYNSNSNQWVLLAADTTGY